MSDLPPIGDQTILDKPPRRYEAVMLQEDGTQRGMVERRYDTGELEYWSALNIEGTHNGVPYRAAIPFKINWIPDGDPVMLFLWEREGWDQQNCRASAWTNLQPCGKACEVKTMADIIEKIEKAQAKQRQPELVDALGQPTRRPA